MSFTITASALAALSVLIPVQVRQGQYHFRAIANFDPQPIHFAQTPPIDVRGQIAFMMSSNQTGQGLAGLLLGQGALNRLLVLVADGFVGSGARSLNDFGEAAYAQDGVFVTNGRTIRRVADPPDDDETLYHHAAINERGTVAFAADLDEDGNTALFIRTRSGTLIDISDGTSGALNFHSFPALDANDRVVFSAYDATRRSSDVYVYDRGDVRLIYEQGSAPCVSGRGFVTFTQFRQPVGATSVFRGNIDGSSRQPVLIADSSGPFTRVLADAVNDHGEVLFRASLPDGGLALCVGDGQSVARVIQPGDLVLGRKVVSVSPGAINDRGALSLEAFFTDGSAAILRAEREQ